MTQSKPGEQLPEPRPAPARPSSVPDAKVSPPAQAKPPRSFTSKLLGVGVGGWVKLAMLCVIVGAITDAGGINPFAPNFTIGGAATAAATGALNALGWAMQAGWRPLLTGALVVLPIWLVWRLVSSAFRN